MVCEKMGRQGAAHPPDRAMGLGLRVARGTTTVELKGRNDEHIRYGAEGGSDWNRFDVPKFDC